jgi:hypothetical protein
MEKVLGPLRAERLARAALSRPTRIAPPDLPRKTLESLVAKSGLDVAEMEKLAAKYRADRHKLAEQKKEKAIAESASLKEFLNQGVAARREANGVLLLPATPPSPFREAITAPSQISASPGVTVGDSKIQPYNSWAKLKQSASSSGSGEVTFSYFWENPNNTDTVFTADAYIVLNGYAQADDNTSYWFLNHETTSLYITVQLEPFNWSENQTIPLPGDFEYAASLSAYGPGWPISVGDIESQNIFRGYDLRAENIVVHANQMMLFQVIMTMQYVVGDGDISVDFSSGAFEIMCPEVLITITS